MRRVIAAVGLLLLTACSGAVQEARANPTQPAKTSPAQRTQAESCPHVSGGNGYAAVDYVDFVQAFGHNYLADYAGHVVRATRADLAQVVLRSQCSFSALNDRTYKDPGKPRDGDTAFLPPGTPIYAVKGWSQECRLAAIHDGRVHIYLAMDDRSATAKARACAVRR
jgi:hypothetical protein